MNTETALTPELLDRYCAVALPVSTPDKKWTDATV
jgi:hypothetical protein